jgi:hypothetical protein
MLLCLAARERTAAQYSGLLAQAGDHTTRVGHTASTHQPRRGQTLMISA